MVAYRIKAPAAFGRLRVETTAADTPSSRVWPAAFGRLRVETKSTVSEVNLTRQPPSGGCVLKLGYELKAMPDGSPAAFGRLRVETKSYPVHLRHTDPAAFGRLRVETDFPSFSAS